MEKKPKKPAPPAEDVVMWVRLPKAMSVAELRKLGLTGAACYGGDTCIAAPALHPEAGIIVTGDLRNLLGKARLVPRDPCFGGDTCIV